jgi:hypothetical protein
MNLKDRWLDTTNDLVLAFAYIKENLNQTIFLIDTID